MQKMLRWSGFGLLTLVLSVSLVFAQDICTDIVEFALESVEGNCVSVGRNQACYGFDQVEAAFVSPVPDDFFTIPADIAEVENMASLRTAPLDTTNDIWGVAVMNLQADLPNTLPGQAVTFVLMGDTEVENAVNPDEAFQPSEGVEISVDVPAGANIRSGPGTNFNVVGGAPPDAILEADGRSQDGEWLRVAYRDRPAWINLNVIAVDTDALNSLPTLSPDLRTPMQAFYLRTGIGNPSCEGVPGDALLVQGPENIEITLTVNGADLQVGSSGVLRIVEIDGEFFLENVVFDGEFNWDGVIVRRGQRTRLCLSDEGDRGLDGTGNDREVTCGASDPEFVPLEEMAEQWCGLEALSELLLGYGLDIPCPDDTVSTGGPASQIPGVDCSAFFIPQQTIIATDFTFDWPDVPGANRYVVAVFDASNREIQTFTTSASSLPTNGGLWPPEGYVDVRAYRDDQYACFARLNFVRGGDPNYRPPVSDAPAGGPFAANIANCVLSALTGQYVATINWSNAPTSSVNITWTSGGVPFSSGGSGTNGSANISGTYATPLSGITVASGSQSLVLGNCP